MSDLTKRIGTAVLEFYTSRVTDIFKVVFTAEELRQYVKANVPNAAPGSSDRILRMLRQKNMLNYMVLSRKASLYKFLPLHDIVTEAFITRTGCSAMQKEV